MLENIKRILKQEDTILFIGSGVSLWSGLPSWSGLIYELIDYLKLNGLDSSLVEQEIKRGELLQAASYGFDKLTKPAFAEFIRRSCRIGTAKPHDIHKKIISLGPTCYITTNYDKLIEQSFHKWLPENYLRTVVNRQLTETAEIVGARAQNFLFKLHGDAEDSESIILTREQYRALNFGGELYHALETTKTLMLSRPIVYIGFGLRDPDFLYVKDLLFNTYKGGARDHYAIMADISDQEKDYWRRNFGIHLINYTSVIKKDGSKDYSPLLHLLDELASTKVEKQEPALQINADFVLSLNRHAAKYSGFEVSNLHLPLVVHPVENLKGNKNDAHFYQYYEENVETLLDEGPEKLVLIGLPGGGKSYSLKGSVARLSKELNKQCIDDSIKLNETIIPIYADLKLYEGSLIELIEQNIPVGMSLMALCSNFRVKLYLDAFNEVPKGYIETNHWNADFSNLLQNFSLSLIISSRTIDGLEDLDFRGFRLDTIDEDFVKSSLTKNHIKLKGLFKNEIIHLLQKPLFYKLIFEDKFQIDAESSPQKIYYNLINQLNQRLNERFQISINLVDPLSKVAMDALDSGEEAFRINSLTKYLNLELGQNNGDSVSSPEIINWLISQNFLIPLINERIGFFHQSITEYLAATRLAVMFSSNDKILKEKLRYRRWDQALFLTLSLLNKTEADKFLDSVIAIDFELALSSIKYIEEDTTEIVSHLLLEIESRDFSDEDSYGISYLLRTSMPISEIHIPLLRKLIDKGDVLGGAAASCLLDLSGYEFKEEALTLLVNNFQEYNFCTEMGRALKKYILPDDLPMLLSLCQKVEEKQATTKNENYEGFKSALGYMMGGFDPEAVFKTFFNEAIPTKKQDVSIDVLFSFLRECRTTQSLKISTKLLLDGIDYAAVIMYFILFFSKKGSIDYSIFNPDHIKSLIQIIKSSENAHWALGSLAKICANRNDLATRVSDEIPKSHGVLKSALHYCTAIKNDHKLVYESLQELLRKDPESLKKEPFELIRHMDDLDWKGHEVLFIKLLKLRDLDLAYNLCDHLALYDDQISGLFFDIGPINWWLDWFAESIESKNKKWMFLERVPAVICTYVSIEKRQEFINEFNNPNSKYRKVINHTILKRLDGLTLEDFSEDAIDYFINDLKKQKLSDGNSPLIYLATEIFVNERLLPLLKSSKGATRKKLEILIDEIGENHKRRYLIK